MSILLQNKDATLILQSRFCEEATVAILSKHWQGPLHVAEDLKPRPTYEPVSPVLTCLSRFHLPQLILVGLALSPLWGIVQSHDLDFVCFFSLLESVSSSNTGDLINTICTAFDVGLVGPFILGEIKTVPSVP